MMTPAEKSTGKERQTSSPCGTARGPREGARERARKLCMRLERDPQAPSLARAAVRDFSVESELSPGAGATLALLVSELVSNAVLHSDAPPRSGIALRARVLGERAVRVEVIDNGSGFAPEPRDPARAIGGFGLFLVNSQAARWGVDREGGTRVWFELRAVERASA